MWRNAEKLCRRTLFLATALIAERVYCDSIYDADKHITHILKTSELSTLYMVPTDMHITQHPPKSQTLYLGLPPNGLLLC